MKLPERIVVDWHVVVWLNRFNVSDRAVRETFRFSLKDLLLSCGQSGGENGEFAGLGIDSRSVVNHGPNRLIQGGPQALQHIPQYQVDRYMRLLNFNAIPHSILFWFFDGGYQMGIRAKLLHRLLQIG